MWYEEMSRSVNQKVVSILVGNKLDMDSRRTVSTDEGRKLGNPALIKPKNTVCHSQRHQQNQVKT